MAKRTKKTPEFTYPKAVTEEPKKGLDIKVKLEKSDLGRLTVTVTLLNDGVVVATDYDFVSV